MRNDYENSISVSGLTKSFGDTKAVDNLTFSVKRGEFFGFLGVNGAGKSTTINMLSTLISPTSGKAEICGGILGKEDNEIRHKIGIVYQNNCLDNMLTVRENLILRGYLYNLTSSECLSAFNKVCNIFSLNDISEKRYKKLSGGQKRRCEIASALMHSPELLFLDEPTTGLDPATRKSVWETITEMRKNYGMTVFLTTHYMEEATEADKIVIIEKGKLCVQGTPFELKEKYAYDKLRIYTDKKLSLKELKKENYGYSTKLNGTIKALDILNNIKNEITGFEVISGTMDDVFLNATGKNLKDSEDLQ